MGIVVFNFPDKNIEWDYDTEIKKVDGDGKASILFVRQNGAKKEEVSFNTKEERDDAYQQIRKGLKDAGILHEIVIHLRK
jgi:hypothetical protein